MFLYKSFFPVGILLLFVGHAAVKDVTGTFSYEYNQRDATI
jgi:hypothetical protein